MAQPAPRFTVLRRMTARRTDEQGRTASPLELLFDLTFVVAVAQIADQLADAIRAGHGAEAIVPFLMVFFAIWWAWMNFTWFASAYDTDDVPYRLMTLVQMAGVLVLAAGVPAALATGSFLGITIGYLIMRVGLIAQWVRAAIQNPDGRATASRYAIGVGVVQLGWVSRLWLPTGPANVWWTVYLAFVVLAVLELAVPPWAERPRLTTWHPHHIAERYGLFTIILLGETIEALAVGIGAAIGGRHDLSSVIVAGISVLVIVFGLWWLYFMEPTGDGLVAHRSLAFYWGYGHYVMFAALGALGAGIEVVVGSLGSGHGLAPIVAAYAIAGPVAIYLVVLWAANAPIVTWVVLRGWVVLPGAIVLALVPMAVPVVGLVGDVVVIAVVLILLIGLSVAIKLRTGQGDDERFRSPPA